MIQFSQISIRKLRITMATPILVLCWFSVWIFNWIWLNCNDFDYASSFIQSKNNRFRRFLSCKFVRFHSFSHVSFCMSVFVCVSICVGDLAKRKYGEIFPIHQKSKSTLPKLFDTWRWNWCKLTQHIFQLNFSTIIEK